MEWVEENNGGNSSYDGCNFDVPGVLSLDSWLSQLVARFMGALGRC